MNTFSNNIIITTAILCKDNLGELIETLGSVCNKMLSDKRFIEILVIDGSNTLLISDYIKSFVSVNFDLQLHYVRSCEIGVFGIYPSMNLALDKARGRYIHFLNSGDTLSDISLYQYIICYSDQQSHPCCFFGQAMIHGKYFSWIFPNIGARSIQLWLRFFEPNHQAMLVLTEWSRLYNRFRLDAPIGADAVWKRRAISQEAVYYPSIVVNFFLGGQSSSYSLSKFKIRYNESWRSPFQKFLEIAKFLLFRFSFVAEFLQMTKNYFTSLLIQLF